MPYLTQGHIAVKSDNGASSGLGQKCKLLISSTLEQNRIKVKDVEISFPEIEMPPGVLEERKWHLCVVLKSL